MKEKLKIIVFFKDLKPCDANLQLGCRVSIRDYDTEKYDPSILELDESGKKCRCVIWQKPLKHGGSEFPYEAIILIKKDKLNIQSCHSNIEIDFQEKHESVSQHRISKRK